MPQKLVSIIKIETYIFKNIEKTWRSIEMFHCEIFQVKFIIF